MHDYQWAALAAVAVLIAAFAVFVYVVVLTIRALRKYVSSEKNPPAASQTASQEKMAQTAVAVVKSLPQLLREGRTRCSMTQEFVARSLGVSRQAVSKWENGTADPSTSNLMALAKLYDLNAEDLIKGIDADPSR